MVMGIRQPEVTTTLNGWPYVSSVPGVGLLGSDQGKTDQDSDIIVMITPRLVDFSPRKDRSIYAGRGTAEGEGGSFGGTRGLDRSAPVQLPQPPQQPPQPPPQTFPQPPPAPQPSPNPENDAPPQPPPQP
jgi:Flp pilus assembly secretin CpaC